MTARFPAFALVAALAIAMTVPAGATSGIALNSFSTTDQDSGDPVGTTTEITTTIDHDWLVIDPAGGIQFIPDSDPNAPNNGDVVGSMTMSAKFPLFLCIRNTYVFDIEWVSPINANAPAGTIAELAGKAPTGDIPMYVVRDGNGNDFIHIDMRNVSVCSSDPYVEISITFYSHVGNRSNGAVVATNGSAGTYTVTVSADGHSDTASYTVN